jgi:hypothetical protein
MCASDGILRAKLDGELAGSDQLDLDAHLAGCARCRRRLEKLGERAGRVASMLSELAPERDAAVDTDAAYTRLEARQEAAAEPRAPGLARWFPARLTPAWGAVAALIVVGVLSTTPGRAAAQRLLGLFRVKSVVAIPVDRDFFADGSGELLGKLLSESIQHSGRPTEQAAADRTQASQLAGFTVRLPSIRQDAPNLTVIGDHRLEFTAEVARLQKLLEIAGRPDLQVPAALDGARIAIHLDKLVKSEYDGCPIRGFPLESQEADWSRCLVVVQTPSPTVTTMPELDLSELAVVGLQLTGMTMEQARRFSETVDWTSTVAIAVPRNAASFENVAVNGVTGLLIQVHPRGQRPPGYSLIWVKDGMIHTISGFGNAAAAIPLAESMG